MHGNNVDTTALLGDSEVFAVKHTPPHTIPEFVQRLKYDGEVAASVAREKAVHVFEDNGSWSASSNEAHELVKQSRLATSKPRSWPHSRKREILAWESCGPDVRFWDFGIIQPSDVIMDGEIGPVLLEDIPAKRLDLAMEPEFEARSLQPKVQTSDTGKEGRN